MFATINFEKSKKRLKKSIKIEKLKIGKIDYLKVNVFKEIPAKKIERKLKNKVDTVLLSKNLSDLEFSKLKVYDSTDFIRKASAYTFIKMIKLSKLKANSISVCVVDKKGEFTDFVKDLVNKASLIKVITQNDKKYLALSDEIYDEYGVQLIFSDDISNCDFGINLDVSTPIIWFNCVKNYVKITKNCIRIGAGLKGKVPKGIYECDFAGILSEYQEFKRLNLITADCFERNDLLYEINCKNIKNFLDIE